MQGKGGGKDACVHLQACSTPTGMQVVAHLCMRTFASSSSPRPIRSSAMVVFRLEMASTLCLTCDSTRVGAGRNHVLRTESVRRNRRTQADANQMGAYSMYTTNRLLRGGGELVTPSQ